MDISRRTIMKSALASALAVATPQSLLAAAERGASSNDRYLLVALRDGNYVAIERMGSKKVFLLTRGPAPDGDYVLAQPGRVSIRGGVPVMRR